MQSAWIRTAGLVPALATALAGTAVAQGVQFDAAAEYAARDELRLEDGDEIDNDFLRLTFGLTGDAGIDGRLRGALELGVRNEDFDGDYPAIGGGELVFARQVGRQRYGIGARFRTADELSTTTELGYAAEHLGDSFDLRGLVGVQLIADEDEAPGRDGSGGFGLVEATIYPQDDFALSAGILADGDGEVFSLAAEFRPGAAPVSFFVEYAEAFDEYRDVPGYDNLSAGIRFTPGLSSVRASRQDGLARILRRPVEVQ